MNGYLRYELKRRFRLGVIVAAAFMRKLCFWRRKRIVRMPKLERDRRRRRRNVLFNRKHYGVSHLMQMDFRPRTPPNERRKKGMK